MMILRKVAHNNDHENHNNDRENHNNDHNHIIHHCNHDEGHYNDYTCTAVSDILLILLAGT